MNWSGPCKGMEIQLQEVEDGNKQAERYFSQTFHTVFRGKFGGVCYLLTSRDTMIRKFIIKISEDGNFYYLPCNEERERSSFGCIASKTHDVHHCVCIAGRIIIPLKNGNRIVFLGISHASMGEPPLLNRLTKRAREKPSEYADELFEVESSVDKVREEKTKRMNCGVNKKVMKSGGSQNYLDEMEDEKIQSEDETLRNRKSSVKQKQKKKEEDEVENVKSPDPFAMLYTMESFNIRSFCRAMRDLQVEGLKKNYSDLQVNYDLLDEIPLELSLTQGCQFLFDRKSVYERIIKEDLNCEEDAIIPFTAGHAYWEGPHWEGKNKPGGTDIVLSHNKCEIFTFSNEVRKIEKTKYNSLDRGMGITMNMSYGLMTEMKKEILQKFDEGFSSLRWGFNMLTAGLACTWIVLSFMCIFMFFMVIAICYLGYGVDKNSRNIIAILDILKNNTTNGM